MLLVALFVGRSLWKANQALSASAREARSNGIPFSLRTLNGQSRGFFGTPLVASDFRSAVDFEGDVFVAGRSSLKRYAADGSLKQTWYPGTDLPPAALQNIAVRRGIGTPELWIATGGAGVLIYDGKQFRQLLPTIPEQKKISALKTLSDGRVVLGTPDAGLFVTDGKHLERLHSQFTATKVSALAGDQDSLWIGTRDAGVWLWRAGEATHYLSELPDPQVLSIAATGDRAWVGTPFGITEFLDGRPKRPLAKGVFAQAIAEANGVLLVSTMDEGMARIPLGTHSGIAASHGQAYRSDERVVAFPELRGEVTALSQHAIRRAESGEVLFSADRELADSHISAVLADHRGRLWIGYFDRGLDILDPQSTKPPEHFEDDVLFCINRIKEDPVTHTVAVGTANGLALFDASGRLNQILDRKHGLIADHVTDLLFTHGNESGGSSIAVATPAGITFVNGDSPASISAFQGLVNNHVYTLAGDTNHFLAGTLGGFSTLDEHIVHASYSTANSSLRQNWITASIADGNAFYLGTYGSGVIRVEADHTLTTFRDFDRARVEINSNALALQNGVVYAGTAGQGLAVLRTGQSRWRFVRDGLPSLNVTAVATGSHGIYVGTDNGLVSMPEQGGGL